MPDPPKPKHLLGRPRLDDADRSVAVTVALPAKQYDHYCRQALREAVSVPEVIRRHLRAARRTS